MDDFVTLRADTEDQLRALTPYVGATIARIDASDGQWRIWFQGGLVLAGTGEVCAIQQGRWHADASTIHQRH